MAVIGEWPGCLGQPPNLLRLPLAGDAAELGVLETLVGEAVLLGKGLYKEKFE